MFSVPAKFSVPTEPNLAQTWWDRIVAGFTHAPIPHVTGTELVLVILLAVAVSLPRATWRYFGLLATVTHELGHAFAALTDRPAARRHPAGPGPLRHHHDVQPEPVPRRLVHVLGLPGPGRRWRGHGVVRCQRLGPGRHVGGHPGAAGFVPLPSQRRRHPHYRRRRAGRRVSWSCSCRPAFNGHVMIVLGLALLVAAVRDLGKAGQRPPAAPRTACSTSDAYLLCPGHLRSRRRLDRALRRGGGRCAWWFAWQPMALIVGACWVRPCRRLRLGP